MNKTEIEKLHKHLLDAWNRRSANDMAQLFTDDGNVIGFDGTQNNGKKEIEEEMEKIFNDHETGRFVWKVKEVRFLNQETAVLRAVVGMIPPGQKDINPAINAIQSLIAVRQDTSWKIALFQNTPAQFHGREDLSKQLTNELREFV
jgi:uncharacterized protein (TIGR02246 family)